MLSCYSKLFYIRKKAKGLELKVYYFLPLISIVFMNFNVCFAGRRKKRRGRGSGSMKRKRRFGGKGGWTNTRRVEEIFQKRDWLAKNGAGLGKKCFKVDPNKNGWPSFKGSCDLGCKWGFFQKSFPR